MLQGRKGLHLAPSFCRASSAFPTRASGCGSLAVCAVAGRTAGSLFRCFWSLVVEVTEVRVRATIVAVVYIAFLRRIWLVMDVLGVDIVLDEVFFVAERNGVLSVVYKCVRWGIPVLSVLQLVVFVPVKHFVVVHPVQDGVPREVGAEKSRADFERYSHLLNNKHTA